ncbi:hypothetical protein [Streptomyces flavidovirens]
MKWPDEVRSPESLVPKPVPVDDEEIQAAIDLMEAMAVEDLSGFHDHYREPLEDLIRAKTEGTKPEGAPVQPAAAPVVDLMSALLDSVESARQARSEDAGATSGDDASVHDLAGHVERKAANAPAAKKKAKAPGKKAAAKKTTGRKSSA